MYLTILEERLAAHQVSAIWLAPYSYQSQWLSASVYGSNAMPLGGSSGYADKLAAYPT